MVRAWYYDNSNLDQRCPHLSDPPEFIDLDTLKDTTGVLYFKIDVENYKMDPLLQRIRTERGYNYEDQITVTPEKLPNYEEKIKMFFEEHLHADEEIRLCIDGSGYFDARDKADRWVRIEMEKGDLIILPAGIYHRFTLDQKNFITANRYFVGEPVWTPINRGSTADEHASRKTYLKDMGLAA